MTIDAIFYTHFEKLNAYKTQLEWKIFFDSIEELEKLGVEINDEMHNDPSDTSNLDARAQSLTKKLEAKKDEIANQTKNKDEYDAVLECISYLEDHFNYTK